MYKAFIDEFAKLTREWIVMRVVQRVSLNELMKIILKIKIHNLPWTELGDIGKKSSKGQQSRYHQSEDATFCLYEWCWCIPRIAAKSWDDLQLSQPIRGEKGTTHCPWVFWLCIGMVEWIGQE